MIPRPGSPANGGGTYTNRLQEGLVTAPPMAEPCQGVG